MSPRLPLLIEIGTEELPPKALTGLAHAFRDAVVAGLERRGIGFERERVRALWSPRRLAVTIAGVEARQPDQVQERRGPAVSAGLGADGAPTRALLGFAQSCGVDVAALERLETDKGAWFVHRALRPGAETASLLPALVAEALAALPVPKPMRWGDREVLFVRPAHWLVLLLGDAVVEGEVLGLRADRLSRGHRFHHPKPVWIADAASYVEALRAAHVLVDGEERRALIRNQLETEAARIGGTVRIREELLDEVHNLVEWPVPVVCAFEREFLRVPAEALITTMEANQKFFPVLDADGRLTECFIGIANVDSREPAEIRKGYERVIRPRFADAAFFFDADLATPLATHQKALENVTYQQKLGSLWDKTVRVAELSRVIANRLGVDAGAATRAAALAKCDLLTRMVGEFPELQGTMGRYYAAAQGEPEAVAEAIEDGYAPRFAGDRIARGPVGRVLAVAEKLDTLAGLFAVGMKPTGNKDPFSLRRTALGLARTLIEGELPLDLGAAFLEAVARIRDTVPAATADHDGRHLDGELLDFTFERLRGYYAEQGLRGDAFEAVLAVRPTDLLDFDRRLRAIVEFADRPEAASLAAANKRIGNILRQAGAGAGDGTFDPALAEKDSERQLADALAFIEAQTETDLYNANYVAVLRRLADLREPVDRFFDEVMVMADDARVRANRLALLGRLRRRFLAIADIGVLQSGS